MKRAIYPGSFDPITNGHLDVAGRALRLFDEVIIAIAPSMSKAPLFSLEERVAMATEASRALPDSQRLQVESFNGLMVDYAEAKQAQVVIRGLRAVSDFEFEFQLALMNRKLNPNVEAIFLMPKANYTYLSSRIVKEISRLGGPVEAFVPECVRHALEQKHRTA